MRKILFLLKRNSESSETIVLNQNLTPKSVLIGIAEEYKDYCLLFLERLISGYTTKVLQGWFKIDVLAKEEIDSLKIAFEEEFISSRIDSFEDFLQMKVDYFFSDELMFNDLKAESLLLSEVNLNSIQDGFNSKEKSKKITLKLEFKEWLSSLNMQPEFRLLLDKLGSIRYIEDRIEIMSPSYKEITVVFISH